MIVYAYHNIPGFKHADYDRERDLKKILLNKNKYFKDYFLEAHKKAFMLFVKTCFEILPPKTFDGLIDVSQLGSNGASNLLN